MSLEAAFGKGTQVFFADQPFMPNSTLPYIPAGYIVHMYVEGSFNGHWMISNGDGTASGCNNDDEDVPGRRIYSTVLNLNEQFRRGFAYQWYRPEDAKKYLPGKEVPLKARVDVINPMTLEAHA